MACAPVTLSWPKVEEVRACQVRWNGVGCLPLVLPLVLVPGLLSKAQQPILVLEQHVGLVSARCPLGVTLSDPNGGLTSSGPGPPAALGTSGCAAGGLLAGADSEHMRLHQGPCSAPTQVRAPHPDL